MSTPNPSTPWVPVWDLVPPPVVPTPVNGKWLTVAGGAMVWDDPIVVADSKWHDIGAVGEPAFQSTWINYDINNYPRAAFRKLSTGLVALKGLLNNTNWPAANGTIAFTLPVGYRPAYYLHIATVGSDGTATVRVSTTGTVQLNFTVAGWVTLDRIEFVI